MKKLEKTLMEELARYNAINKYTTTLLEQGDVPPPVDAAPVDPNVPPADPNVPPADPVAGAAPMEPAAGAPPSEDTEEIDITDLVNMTKSIKKDLDDTKSDNSGVVSKMDTVFDKLTDLEQKLSQMDAVMNKIEELGNKVEMMKEKTPQEKLEMRSLDSYPFNLNPQQFFSQKQSEMQQSGKNEYVLTKQDIDNYSTDMIKDTFNGETEEDEFKY
jgi:hypothetical protein